MTRTLKLAIFLCLSTLTATAADLNGRWIFQSHALAQIWGKTVDQAGSQTIIMDLMVTKGALTGAVIAPGAGVKNVVTNAPISNAKIDGDNLSFDVVRQGYLAGSRITTTTHYIGALDGDTIHLTINGAEHVDAHRSGAQQTNSAAPARASGDQAIILSHANPAQSREASITAPGRGLQNYNFFRIDTRDFRGGGTLIIDIEIAPSSATDGSFDLFPADAISSTGAPTRKPLTGSYDVRRGTQTQLKYHFVSGDVFALNLQGNWFSPKGATGSVQFQVSVLQ